MGLFDKEEKVPDRFKVKSSQYIGGLHYVAVVVDTETGINYIFTGGDNCSMTPMVDAEGKIVVDEIVENLGEKIY